jgi:hypothetical protein
MTAVPEFLYALPHRVRGGRPGAHAGRSAGPGTDFVHHQRLFEHPDPRRLDLRASLRQPGADWMVRVNRQRTSMVVRVAVDVSASMAFGAPRSKLALAADLVESLGLSAWRLGDAVELCAFDQAPREDLHQGPSLARGASVQMAQALRSHLPRPGGSGGAADSMAAWAGRTGLVFLVSDFRWPQGQLAAVLDRLVSAAVVPVVVDDPAEACLPPRDGLLEVQDAETGRGRSLWLRPRLRVAWQEAEQARQQALGQALRQRQLRPFRLQGRFDAEAMSRYFLEGHA